MRWAAALVVFLLVPTGPAEAGRSCEEKVLSPQAVQEGFETGLNVFERLNAMEPPPEVVMLGRVGSDVSKYGLRYTHMGFVVRDHPNGRYTAVHLLNHCDSPTSSLFIQGLANFFLDDPMAYDSLLLIPSPELQKALAERLIGPIAGRLHEPRYNVVARPGSQSYQNSNQWALEVLIAAMADADPWIDRRRLHELPLHDSFHGDRIHLSRWKRLGGLFRSNVDFFDQPLGNRLRSDYEIITVRSVERWLHGQGRLTHREVLQGPAQELPGRVDPAPPDGRGDPRSGPA